MDTDDIVVVEGRITDVRVDRPIADAALGAEIVLTIDLHMAWRVGPTRVATDWRSWLLIEPAQAFPRFHGPTSLATAGLRVGQVVVILGRRLGGRWLAVAVDIERPEVLRSGSSARTLSLSPPPVRRHPSGRPPAARRRSTNR
jgi:hypothetical protein